MAYGIKYYLEFCDIKNLPYKINIYQRDFTGVAVKYMAGEEPIAITYKAEEESKFAPITGSEAILSIMQTGTFPISDFLLSDERKYKIELLQGTVKKWSGFIIPDDSSEPFQFPPYAASIKATDILGTLKNEPFKLKGEQNIKDILISALSSTGLEMPLKIGTALQYDGADITKCPFEQAKLNTERFYDNNRQALSVYDVVKSICTMFSCSIRQVNGEWFIANLEELSRLGNLNYWTYSATGVYLSSGVLNSTIESGDRNKNIFIAQEGIIVSKPAYKSVDVYYQYGYKSNQVFNGDFDLVTNGDFDGWSIYGLTKSFIDDQGTTTGDTTKSYYVLRKSVTGWDGVSRVTDDYCLGFGSNVISSNERIMFSSDYFTIKRDLKSFTVSFSASVFTEISNGIENNFKDNAVFGLFQIKTDGGIFFTNINDKGELTSGGWTTSNHNSMVLIKGSMNGVSNENWGTFSIEIPPFKDDKGVFVTTQMTISLNGLGINVPTQTSGTNGAWMPNHISEYIPTKIDNLKVTINEYESAKSSSGRVLQITQTRNYSFKPETTQLLFNDEPTVDVQDKGRTSWIRDASGVPTKGWKRRGETGRYKILQQLVAENIMKLYQLPGRTFENDFIGSLDNLNSVISIQKLDGTKWWMLNGTINVRSRQCSLLLAEITNQPPPPSTIQIFEDYGDYGKTSGNKIGQLSGVPDSSGGTGSGGSSQFSEHALTADRATLADLATDATHALNADNATLAIRALDADRANYALDSDKWDGRQFDDYLNQPVRTTDSPSFMDIQSVGYVSGFTGTGFKMLNNGDAEFDSLTIRKQLNVTKLNIREITGSGGSVAITNVALIKSVTDMTSVWRCFIDTDSNSIALQLRLNDLVRCQVWDGKGVKYYLAKVSNVGTDYFDLLKSTKVGAGIPAPKDNVFQFGNTTDTSRQGLIYLTNSDTGAPYLDVLDGINSDNLAGKTRVRVGKLNGINSLAFGNLTGYGLFADNVYLEGQFSVGGKKVETQEGAQAKIDAIKIGGRNLIFGGFVNGRWNQASTGFSTADNHGRTINVIPLEVGKEYSFSMRSDTVVQPNGIWITFRNADDTYNSVIVRSAVPFTFTAPTTKCTITFNCAYYTASNGGATLNALLPQLEEGNVSTAWKMSQEDVQAQIDKAQALASADAQTKADIAKEALRVYVDAQDNLKKTEALAYADGIVTTEEQARINADIAKLAEAKADATAKVNTAQSASALDATTKANLAKLDATASAKAYADAQDALKKTEALAYADGKITIEEQARINADIAKLEEAKADATTKANTARQSAIDASAIDTQAKIDAIKLGGRNTYIQSQTGFTTSNATPVKNTAESPNGFQVTGNQNNNTLVRLNNVITSNGFWTVSGFVKGSQSTIGSFKLDICDSASKTIAFTADNNWTYFEYTVAITSYSTTYNFVDFAGFTWNYFFLKDIKIENGSKATGWTPAPEDVALDAINAQTALTNSLKAYSDAQDALKKTEALAYADGKITIEEQARINADIAKLAEAKADATAKANQAQTASALDATAKANTAQTNATNASKAYSDAQDALKKTEALAYADGIVTAEEQARINADTAKLAEAKADSLAKANIAQQTAIDASALNTTAKISAIKLGGRNLIFGGFVNGRWNQASTGFSTADNHGRTINVIPLEVGKEYSFSMRSDTVVQPSGVWITFRNADDTYNSVIIKSTVPFTFIAPTTKCTITFNCAYYTSTNGGTIFESLHPQLEKGNIPSDWTPSIEDPIELPKLGQTIISGGKIRTDLLEASAVRTMILSAGLIKANEIDVLNLFAQAITATNLTVSGTSKMTAGTIGGWTINSNEIYSGTQATDYIALRAGIAPEIYMKNSSQITGEYSSLNTKGLFILSTGNTLPTGYGDYKAVGAFKLKGNSPINSLALYCSAPPDRNAFWCDGLSCFSDTVIFLKNVLISGGQGTELSAAGTVRFSGLAGTGKQTKYVKMITEQGADYGALVISG